MGTYNYLAPEYITSALRPDIRSDIYSLGAVLFEVLSGRLPFAAETLATIATSTGRPPRPIWPGWRRTRREKCSTRPPDDGQGAAPPPANAPRANRPTGGPGNWRVSQRAG